MTDFDALLDGSEKAQAEIETLADCQQAVRALARHARTSIRIVSRELDPRLYDDANFLSSIRQFIVESNHARLEVLVRNVEPIVRNGHRLLSLAQSLTSFCEFRQLGRDHQSFNSAFMLIDGRSALLRPLADRYEGTFSAYDRVAARELTHQFDEMWATGVDSPNLRRLSTL